MDWNEVEFSDGIEEIGIVAKAAMGAGPNCIVSFEDLVREVADETGNPINKTEKIIRATFRHIGDEVADGNSVRVSKFGTFKRVTRKGRAYTTPQGVITEIGDRYTIKMSPALELSKRFKSL